MVAVFVGPHTPVPQVFCLRKRLLPNQSSDLEWKFRKEWERAWALEEKLLIRVRELEGESVQHSLYLVFCSFERARHY
jgi:hypothetical protein